MICPHSGQDCPNAAAPAKKKRPRGRDYAIDALGLPGDVEEAFGEVWKAWPQRGWNLSLRVESPRRINYAESAKRFWEIIQFSGILKEGGAKLDANDLAQATFAYLKAKKKEAYHQHLPVPVIPCIGNFFSCCEGEKHHWKEAVLQYFQAVPQ